MSEQAADRQLEGPALRQLRADPRHVRGGVREHARGQAGREEGARHRGRARQRDAAPVREDGEGVTLTRARTASRRPGAAGPSRMSAPVEKRVVFRSWWLPYALVAPQLAITIVFFFLPAGQAVWQSLLAQDPFGINVEFVGLDNFRRAVRRRALPGVVPRHRGVLGARGRARPVDLAGARRVRRPGDARRQHLQDAADLALRGGARGRGRAVAVPVQPDARRRRPLDQGLGYRVGPAAATTTTR